MHCIRYYYKARIYSPTLGRFLQTDPIGYEDQYNLYAYVGNDPVNAIDPSGEALVKCTQRDNDSPVCNITDDGSDDITLEFTNERTSEHDASITKTTVSRTFKGNESQQIRDFNSQVDILCGCNDGDRIVGPKGLVSRIIDDTAAAMFGGGHIKGKRGRGSNRRDRKQIDDAARQARITDRRGFGKFIEKNKKAEGRRGDENYTHSELREFAERFKSGER